MSLRGKTVVITTPAWLQGDGVGHDVDGMTRALLSAGCKVTVYSQDYAPAHEDWRVDFQTVRRLLDDPSSILIHHHSIGCAELEGLLKHARSNIRIMRYHNVTPPEFFEGYSDDWVRSCAHGRRVTVELVPYCTEFSVPSFYDARDLVHAGAPVDRIIYCPYFHKLEDFDRVLAGAEVSEQLRSDTRLKVLFLGRRVNNKGHLHLIRTIAAYRRLFDKDIVLHLVGSPDANLKGYDDEIFAEIDKHSLGQNVVIHDKLPFSDIVAFYKLSDVFLCMSEHEGFCIPVIEAEYCRLPVIAYYRRGVPEALGCTQPWLTSLHYDEYARILRRIHIEPNYASGLGEAGATSVRERFDIEAIRSRFLLWVDDLDRVSNPEADRGKQQAVASGRKKVAFVVQRFGRNVAGGAEAFARMYAERLGKTYDITVLTTTSQSLDWDNERALVIDDDLGEFEVIRFPPHYKRSAKAFEDASARAFAGEISYEEFQMHHGPHVPELGQYLTTYGDEFDLIINWTYIFETALYAPLLAGRVKTVNVPFFHDERLLYMQGCRENSLKYDANIYQTYSEKQLAERTIAGISSKKAIVLGAGVDELIFDRVRATDNESLAPFPYIVYVGRIDQGKGVPKLIEYFKKYKNIYKSNLRLVIIGRAHDCLVEEDDDIVLPGFVSEEEKAAYMKHAVCLINPSHFESFSLVLIESWALGRPVMVVGQCSATTSQVERSGGGLVYSNFRDFAWSLQTLERDEALGHKLGANGYQFYEEQYRWAKLLPKVQGFLDKMIGA